MAADSATFPRAVVLLSGGLDSAVVLAVARREGFACYCLSFDYGQRHGCELAAAGRVARALGGAGVVEHRTVRVDLRAIGGSALTDEIAVPRGSPLTRPLRGHPLPQGEREQPLTRSPAAIDLSLEGRGRERTQAGRLRHTGRGGAEGAAADEGGGAAEIPVTYVPGRNLVFLSLASAYAEVVGAGDVFIGVNAVDYSGYPDCRREFVDAFERAAALGTKAGVEGKALRVRTPLVALSKAEIVRLGAELGVDFSLTHSCYDPSPEGLACGACDSCRLRRKGFEEAGVADPTRYAGQCAATGAAP